MIDYKESAHAVLEAETSQDLQSAPWGASGVSSSLWAGKTVVPAQQAGKKSSFSSACWFYSGLQWIG